MHLVQSYTVYYRKYEQEGIAQFYTYTFSEYQVRDGFGARSLSIFLIVTSLFHFGLCVMNVESTMLVKEKK